MQERVEVSRLALPLLILVVITMRRIVLCYADEIPCLDGIVLTSGWIKAHPGDKRYRIVAEKLTVSSRWKHGTRA